MENRLEFFRAQMAAFDGAADPCGAIDRGVYIEEPKSSSTNQLFKRIQLQPNSQNLLIGGIGSGKTTQLLRLEKLFRSGNTDIYPHYVDVSLYDNSENIKEGLLDAIAGLELIKVAKQENLSVNNDLQSRISHYAYGQEQILPPLVETINKSLLPSGGLFNSTTVRRGGVIPLQPGNRSKTITDDIAELVSSIKLVTSKTPFFLFDGLDRISDITKFIDAAASSLNDAGCGCLIVGPIGVLYSQFMKTIDLSFSHVDYRPAFSLDNDEEAYSFFEKILRSRTTDGFFTPFALERTIYKSGGVLRDLINLAQRSIQEAYLDDAEQVEERHARKADFSLGRAKMLGLEKDESEVLSRLSKEPLKLPTSPEELSLLASGRILEYRYPSQCFAIHPALKDLIPQFVAA